MTTRQRASLTVWGRATRLLKPTCFKGLGLRRYTGAVAMLASLVIAGCASLEPSPFAARVTAFQQWPSDAVGQRYRFADAQSGSLEQQNYQDLLRVQLSRVGLVEVQAWERHARFTVGFTTDVQPYQTWTEVPSPYPYYYGAPTLGFGYGHHWGWGYSMMVPFGGFGGYGYQPVPVTAWRYTLQVSIRDANRNGAEVYQGTATHTDQGSPDELPYVMPYLAEALFTGFPQPNGEASTVRVRR